MPVGRDSPLATGTTRWDGLVVAVLFYPAGNLPTTWLPPTLLPETPKQQIAIQEKEAASNLTQKRNFTPATGTG
jgi:hypothetical protein